MLLRRLEVIRLKISRQTYAIVYANGFDLLLDFDKLGTGSSAAGNSTPKKCRSESEARRQPLEQGWTCAHNTRLSYLTRKKVCQLQFATDPGVSLHVQQTAQSAYLQSLSGFFDVPTEYRPFSLYKNNDRKAAGPSFLFSYRWLSRSLLIHFEYPPSSRLTLFICHGLRCCDQILLTAS